jgi:hypothetical protein
MAIVLGLLAASPAWASPRASISTDVCGDGNQIDAESHDFARTRIAVCGDDNGVATYAGGDARLSVRVDGDHNDVQARAH